MTTETFTAEQWTAMIHRCHAAVATLQSLGYTYRGGERWECAKRPEEPSRDAERLDWLQRQVNDTHTGDGGHGSRLRLSWSSGVPGLRPMNLRDYVDAASSTKP